MFSFVHILIYKHTYIDVNELFFFLLIRDLCPLSIYYLFDVDEFSKIPYMHQGIRFSKGVRPCETTFRFLYFAII